MLKNFADFPRVAYKLVAYKKNTCNTIDTIDFNTINTIDYSSQLLGVESH